MKNAPILTKDGQERPCWTGIDRTESGSRTWTGRKPEVTGIESEIDVGDLKWPKIDRKWQKMVQKWLNMVKKERVELEVTGHKLEVTGQRP